MKAIKKFLALLLCLFISIGFVCPAAFAETPDRLDVKAEKTGEEADSAAYSLSVQAEQTGDTVTVTISFNEEIDDFYGTTLTIDYDKDAFARGSIQSPIDKSAQWAKQIVIEAADGHLSAGDIIAVLTFDLTDSFIACYQYQFTVAVVEAINVDCEDIALAGAACVLPGHDWNDPTYTWADDYSSVTATRSCKHDASHVETETVNTTSEITKPATCEAKGETTYTATFTNAAFTTQTKVIENIDALGHDWNEPTYSWADDYSTVTATRICKHDASHVETETVNTTSEITKPATCEAKGETTYTAAFTNAAFTTQTKVIENIDALGHEWNEPSYSWADDYSTVTATRSCKHDASHVETETVDTTYEVIAEPTATTEGMGRYTAVFDAEFFITQTKDVPIEKLPGYVISLEDYTKDNAACDIDTTTVYNGEVKFTVRANSAVLVALRTKDGIAALPCTTDEEGNHNFSVNVKENITILLVFKGDVNLDGSVTLKDSLAMKKHIAGAEEITDPFVLLVGDINGDGAIKLKDSLAVKKNIAGTEYIAW